MAVSEKEGTSLLPYEICDFSSSSGNFAPKYEIYNYSDVMFKSCTCSHILVDKPSDQKSRWLSDGNKPPQEASSYISVSVLGTHRHKLLSCSRCGIASPPKFLCQPPTHNLAKPDPPTQSRGSGSARLPPTLIPVPL